MVINLLKKVNRLLVILIGFIVFYNPSYSQKTFEFGLYGGTSHYIGDLSPNINLNRTNLSAGVNFTYSFNNYVSLGAHLTTGKIEGYDSDFEYLSKRNLSFYSNITEFGLI
jgi:hypothetical protein